MIIIPYMTYVQIAFYCNVRLYVANSLQNKNHN